MLTYLRRLIACALGVWSPSRIAGIRSDATWLHRWEGRVDQGAIDSGEARAAMAPSPEVAAALKGIGTPFEPGPWLDEPDDPAAR